MSQPLKQARRIIVAPPTESAAALAPLDMSPNADTSIDAQSDADASVDADAKIPDSYIREIRPLLDDPGFHEAALQLSALSKLRGVSSLAPDISLAPSSPPPLPRMHPILNRDTPLEDLPVRKPPQCSILRWLWLAITCS